MEQTKTRSERSGAHDQRRGLPTESECRALLYTIEGYVLVADAARRIRWMNRSPLGREVPEFLGRDFVEFVAVEHRALVEAAAQRILLDEPSAEVEARGALTHRWYRYRITGVRELGVISGFAIHALDIDDFKRSQTEQAVLVARARAGETRCDGALAGGAEAVQRRLDLMADALPVLISYVDSERCYQYNNVAYERWFGTTRRELRGRTIKEVIGTDAYRDLEAYVDAALGGELVTFEMTLPYKDAGVRTVVAHYVPDVASDGNVKGFYALIEDVTARREAEAALRRREDELRQLQKMEALGRLASGMAHDFNNLLMTVTMGCSNILRSVPEDSPAASTAARVLRAAQRESSMIRQLLSFSRASELQTGPIDLDALVEDMAGLLERLLDSNIQLEVAPNCRRRIVANAGQLQQIIMNMTINARDALPGGGRLRLETHGVDSSSQEAPAHGELKPGAYALLTISDTGTGMDASTRERIFDPFFTTKEPGKGTGLGLSTVYGIMRQLGGHIEVESALGRGTTFRLYFPAVESELIGPPASR